MFRLSDTNIAVIFDLSSVSRKKTENISLGLYLPAMEPHKHITFEDLRLKNAGKTEFVSNDSVCRDVQFKAVTVVEPKDGYGAFVDLTKGVLRKAVIANTKLDRARDVFTIASLEHFAKQLQAGKVPLQLFHNSYLPVGTWVDGEVKATADGYELEAVMFIHSGMTLPNQSVTVVDAVDSGVLKHVSVGFSGMKYSYIEKEDGGSYWEINPNPGHPDGGLLAETSLVPMGAQRGAEVKDANQKPKRALNNMETTFVFGDQTFVIKGSATETGVEVKGLQEFASGFTKALADTVQAKTETAKLQADINAVREKCIADVVNFTRTSEKPVLLEDAQKMTTSELVAKAISLAGEVVETKAAPETATAYKNPFL